MSPQARILLVEDEEHIAMGIEEVLDLEGYTVEVRGQVWNDLKQAHQKMLEPR